MSIRYSAPGSLAFSALLLFAASMALIDAHRVDLQAETIAAADIGAAAAASTTLFDLGCMECMEEDGSHRFITFTEELCGDPEFEPEFGECRACGGSSQCHADPQPGPCHASCEETFATAQERLDGWLAAITGEALSDEVAEPALIAREVALNPNVSIDRENGVLELAGCPGLKATAIWDLPVAVDRLIASHAETT